MKTTALVLLLASAPVASACDRSLVPGALYDRPLLSLKGSIRPTGGLGGAKHPIVGLLWTDPLQRQPDVPMPPRWLRSAVNVADDTFTVEVFRPPPAEAIVDIRDSAGESSRLAIAEIVIVDDQDGDGTFRVEGARATVAAPDRYVAGSPHVLTYVDTPYPSPQINTPLTMPAQVGYAVVNYDCAGQLSQATHEVPPQAVEMILHPSQDFPNARTCRASHGP